MARIPYADPTIDTEIAALAEQIKAERGGKLLNLYRMLLHSPPVARGWLAMFTAIRQQTILSGRYRELAILRVAVLNGADYEFAQHIPFALKDGCTAEEIEAVRTGSTAPIFNDRDRAVLAYTEAMTRDIRVPDAVFGAISAFIPEREIVELTATVAGYTWCRGFLRRWTSTTSS